MATGTASPATRDTRCSQEAAEQGGGADRSARYLTSAGPHEAQPLDVLAKAPLHAARARMHAHAQAHARCYSKGKREREQCPTSHLVGIGGDFVEIHSPSIVTKRHN